MGFEKGNIIFRLFNLKGRIAFVSGSTSGLGLTIARVLAEGGARVILNGRNKTHVENTIRLLRKEGFTVYGFAFDVTDNIAVKENIDAIHNDIGEIDILVNNAGIQDRAYVIDMNDNQWERVIKTNLTGAFILSRAVGRYMIKRRSGKVINVCSLMSEITRPTLANYAAAKGGLKMLTKSLAVEWGKYNIQVNGIGPGYFRTKMTEILYKDKIFREKICERIPAGRWGRPSDLAGTILFLASEASDYVNGQIIYVDGGLLSSL